MVRIEIWACLLAYNAIRKIMLQAAMESDLSPRQLSFANAMQTMAASWIALPTLGNAGFVLLITVQQRHRSFQKEQIGNDLPSTTGSLARSAHLPRPTEGVGAALRLRADVCGKVP